MKKIILLVLLFNVNTAFAQHWVEQKKDWTATFSQEFRTYSKVYDFDGNRLASPAIDHFVSELKGEYALANFLSVGISVPFVHNAIYKNIAYGITSNEKVNSAGDMQLSLNYLMNFNKTLYFNVFYRQSFATSETDAVYGLNTGYGDNAQHIGLVTRFKTQDRFYATFDIGYKLRHKDFGDEIIALAELGYRMAGKFWILGRSHGIQPLENGDDNLQGGNFGLYQQYGGSWNTGLGLRYSPGKWDFTALLSGNFKGQYSPAAAFCTLELRYKFLKRESEED